MIALGLPMKALDLGLGWSPGPVRVDERLHAHPSKNPKLNLMLQNTCLNHIFINQIIIPYLLFIQSPIYQKSSYVLI